MIPWALSSPSSCHRTTLKVATERIRGFLCGGLNDQYSIPNQVDHAEV
jgi:hypothetical protein